MKYKAYKFRLYPNQEQIDFFMRSFGCVRFVYNWGLKTKQDAYRLNKKSPSAYDLCNELKELKLLFPWLRNVSHICLQRALFNLDKNFIAFFKKIKNYPKFKSKNRNNFSFSICYAIKIRDKKIRIPKIGFVKFIQDRKINGKMKSFTVTRNRSGEFYISILVEENNDVIALKKINPETTIGIDLGIKDFAILSTGEKIANPKYFRKALKKIKREQKRHYRKKSGSKSRNKNRIKVAKLYNKVVNQRKNFIHKITYDLTHNNQVSTICIENLSPKNMIKNHKLALAIHDVGWGLFRQTLEYKCNWYGINLIIIGRFDPSTKMCSCGNINNSLTLADREWICPKCKTLHDRDILAANNIKKFGIKKYFESTVGSTGIYAEGETKAQAVSSNLEVTCG